jgi:4-oxalocrotonate tautomerase
MPVISATFIEGRSIEAKRRFASALTDAAVDCLQIDAAQVRVIFNEVSADHFAIGGITVAERRDLTSS